MIARFFNIRFLSAAVSALAIAGAVQAADRAPHVDKVDPPNWWVGLKDPMLLVRGENLAGARFETAGPDAKVCGTQTSPNGHWAVVRLCLGAERPGKLEITASNSDGRTSFAFPLAARRPAAEGPKGFSSRDTLYLIMTDRFADGRPANDVQPGLPSDRSDPHGWHGGDVAGVDAHLDYIQGVGATAVWLTPLYENRLEGGYHGYNASDLYAVDPHYGTMADVQGLSADLHRRGMKFVLDIVPNHVGPTHVWAQDPPTNDWLHGSQATHRTSSGEFGALIDPTASERMRRDVLEGWFVGLLPDLNQSSPLVSEYLIQNAIWWVESTGADAIRLDTFPYVDRSFWRDFHAELKALYPSLTTVGEVFNGTFALPPALNAAFAGGVTRVGSQTVVDTGLWTPFDYPFYAVARNVLARGAPMSDLALLFEQDALYPHPERLATLIGSHDTRRFMSEPGMTTAKLKLAFGLLLTVRGMPVIYSGDEIAMRGDDDPDNRRDFPGGFAPTPAGGFDAFTGRGAPPEAAETLSWVRDLSRLRASLPELQAGDQQIESSDQDTLSFVRGERLAEGCAAGRARALVVANRAAAARTVTIATDATALAACSSATVRLGGASAQVAPGRVSVEAPAESVAVVELR